MNERQETEDQIAEAISQSRGGCAAAGTVANKIGRGLYPVRAALDAMVRAGRVDCAGGEDPQHDLFRLIIGGRVVGTLPARWWKEKKQVRPREVPAPRPAVAAPSAPIPQDDDDDIPDGMTVEHLTAANLWSHRMGIDRWHDDPRALAEQRSNKHLLPFSERGC